MGNRWYIVDYDIPESPAKERVQFYRDMELIKSCGVENGYSTLSVFRTKERVLAEAVYLLVTTHKGSAHVYVGEEITKEMNGKSTF